MTEQNQVQVQEEQAVKIMDGLEIVREDDNYVVVKTNEGKYLRKAKFEEFSSFVAETKEDKIWLFNLLDSADDESANGLKNQVGKHIKVQDVILRPYDKINEETGVTEYGVLTYIITPDRQTYATSSKSVYFTMKGLFQSFGEPAWDDMTIKVGKVKRENGDQIVIKPI